MQKSGFAIPHMIKDSPDKGQGVFTKVAIRKGDIVWRHVPENLTVYDEQSYKALITPLSDEEVRYELTHVFGLHDFPGCLIRIHDAGVLINHSDKANLATNTAATPQTRLDPSSPTYLRDVVATLLTDRYALIATRDIAIGEELTNDYAAEVVDPPFYEQLCTLYDVDESYIGD